MSTSQPLAGTTRRGLARRVGVGSGSWFLLLISTCVCGGEAGILANSPANSNPGKPASLGYGFAAAGAFWPSSAPPLATPLHRRGPAPPTPFGSDSGPAHRPAPISALTSAESRSPTVLAQNVYVYADPANSLLDDPGPWSNSPANRSSQGENLDAPGTLPDGIGEFPPVAQLPTHHAGRGQPLIGTSWMNRPYYAGWLFGVLIGDAPIAGQLDQDDDLFGGYRLGWDFDPFWGVEGRYAFSFLELEDARTGTNPGTALNEFWDINLLYYPWGDSRWRPFASVGLGVAQFRFNDGLGVHYDESLLHMPLGIGVKHYFRNWLALRFTVMDNLAWGGSGLDAMQNMSITGDVEVHFGGRRTSYYPWNPSTSLW